MTKVFLPNASQSKTRDDRFRRPCDERSEEAIPGFHCVPNYVFGRKFLHVVAAMIILLAMLGCGRKMDPMPPGDDPATVTSAKFVKDKVVIKVNCTATKGNLVLLGKAKGICPVCLDDMTKKAQVPAKKGVFEFTDDNPDESCMVYRAQTDTPAYTSPSRIACK